LYKFLVTLKVKYITGTILEIHSSYTKSKMQNICTIRLLRVKHNCKKILHKIPYPLHRLQNVLNNFEGKKRDKIPWVIVVLSGPYKRRAITHFVFFCVVTAKA
jgi:hypothetical protein